ILTWSGPKPSTGLPAAAREARYRLLAEAAQAEGIGMILTGHTADDQAETVLMRHARDEGQGHAGMAGRGLAGMAPATLYDWRIWIVRPLLGVRRAVLRDVLRRQNVGWADDPTNVDAAFERPRVRAALAGESVEHVKGMLMLAGQAALERRQLGASAAGLIDGFASQPAIGLIRLDPCLLSSGDEQAAVYALRILLATTGGIAFLPDQARSEALFGRLRAGFLCATLSRTVVDSRRSGIFLRREARGLPAAAAATGSTLWDGRRHITLNDSSSALLIAPLGAAAAKRLATGEGKTPSSLMRAALAAEPAVWQAGECLGLPGYGLKSAMVEARPVVAPFGRFLPSFDLAPARAVAGLIGAAPVPPLPFSGHSAG
ncbi:tRNA lysidine(34) synthetase TilS, partial [Mesorhizobium sp. M7A.F.Ca.US.003.02.1.1]